MPGRKTGASRTCRAVLLATPALEAALVPYRDQLGQELIWRSSTAAGLRTPDSTTELVLHTARPKQETDARG
jgi:hypothetical protein